MGRAGKKRAVANTDRIVKMYKAGSNIVQISEEMGLFRRNVKAILVAEGILRKRATNMSKTSKGYFAEELRDYYKQFNAGKLKLLVKLYNPNWKYNVDEYKQFIEKFYNDSEFNRLYSRWQETGDIYFRPTIDHKTPKSKGGGNELDNLQCLSWFENKIKFDLLPDEWVIVKQRAKKGEYLS
jgi:5-methylcytosine-specific restriction endonuclease McrA